MSFPPDIKSSPATPRSVPEVRACPRNGRNANAYCVTPLPALLFLCICLTSLVILWHHLLSPYKRTQSPIPYPTPPSCRAPLPRLLLSSPPSPSHPAVVRASAILSTFLSDTLALPGVDSLTVGVVSPEGTLYEWTGGRKRANESDGEEVHRESLYRIGSVSKLFAMIEVLVLKQRGALKLDDAVTSFFPNFTYLPFRSSAPSSPPSSEPITLRQLATHMSGIARDQPPLIDTFPAFPTVAQSLEAVSRTPLVAPPWTLPVYSNTGWALLGAAAVVAANRQAREMGEEEVPTFAELLQRDVLRPLGMNGSTFRVTDANRARVVVPANDSFFVDLEFHDWDPVGGQYSSLSDLTETLRTLLDPSLPGSVLSAYTLREWMRPAHAFWDEWSEVGLAWEIMKVEDKWGRARRVYQKWGNIATSHTSFSVNPESSYGVIVLNTGLKPQTMPVTLFALNTFQKAFDEILADEVSKAYVGTWRASGAETRELRVLLLDGGLWLDGEWFLREMRGESAAPETEVRFPEPVALWWMGSEDFRVAVDYPGFEGGCFGLWAELDQYEYRRGYPMNLVRYEGDGYGRRMGIPALGLEFERVG